MNESDFFRCQCGKVHMNFSGQFCPCGQEFPRDRYWDFRQVFHRKYAMERAALRQRQSEVRGWAD